MIIQLTGEQLGIDREELLDVIFDVELDDETLIDDVIHIENVENSSHCDLLDQINYKESYTNARLVVDRMKDEKLIQDQASRREIDV